MPDELPELDEYYVRLLDRRAAPGETRDETIRRLLIDTLVDGPGAAAREQVRGWAEALAWFAKRTKGGSLSMLVHQEFVERFDVDPYADASAQDSTGHSAQADAAATP